MSTNSPRCVEAGIGAHEEQLIHISRGVPGHGQPDLSVHAMHKQVSEAIWSTVGPTLKIDSTTEAFLAKI